MVQPQDRGFIDYIIMQHPLEPNQVDRCDPMIPRARIACRIAISKSIRPQHNRAR